MHDVHSLDEHNYELIKKGKLPVGRKGKGGGGSAATRDHLLPPNMAKAPAIYTRYRNGFAHM